jgi:hypothetical protein
MKNTKTTFELFVESMTPEERKKFDKEFRSMAISEMIYAAMEDDVVNVKKLAKLAGFPPSIVKDLHSGKSDKSTIKALFKVFHRLGFKVLLQSNGETMPLDMSWLTQEN